MNMQTTERKQKTFSEGYQEWLKEQKDGEGSRAFKRCLANILKGIKPKQKLTPDAWADSFRYLVKGSRPGKWDTSFTPYLRGILQAFADDKVETIVAMLATQLGKTAGIECIIGWVIHQNAAPMYFVMPDEAMIRDFKQEKLEDMFESTPLFYKEGLVKRASPGSSETTDRKIRFPGGYIAFASSNSMAALAGRSIRFLFLDEVDRFKVSKGEGDVIAIAKNRTNSFAENRKIFITSTPTDSANSRINKAYLQGDQRKYFIHCPHCGHRQLLQWDHVEWDKTKDKEGNNIHHPETAYFRCSENGCSFHNTDKAKFLLTGEWIATALAKDSKTVSFQLSQLYSPFVPLEDVVRAYLAAKDQPGGLRAFYNTMLAEVYDDPAEQPQYEKLYARAETYTRAKPPRQVGFLTCGADIQEKGDGRIEASVWGWGPKNQRWLIDHIVIPGNYKDPETWQHLTDFRSQKFITDDGRELSIALTLVDSSAGNTTNYVYEYCRLYRNDNVKAVKGSNRQDSKIIEYSKLDKDSNGKTLSQSITLVRPNVHQLKKWLYHAISEVDDTTASHYVHTPQFVGLEWHRQLCAEKVLVKGNQQIYVKTYANEALDCANYAMAGALILGLDRTDWAELFKRQGAPLTDDEKVSIQVQTKPANKDTEEICILKRVQILKQWFNPGDILDVSKTDAARLCSGVDPFAHITSERPPLKSEITIKKAVIQQAKQKPPKVKPKSWFKS